MAWMDNIKTWTRLPVKESVRMTDVVVSYILITGYSILLFVDP